MKRVNWTSRLKVLLAGLGVLAAMFVCDGGSDIAPGVTGRGVHTCPAGYALGALDNGAQWCFR